MNFVIVDTSFKIADTSFKVLKQIFGIILAWAPESILNDSSV